MPLSYEEVALVIQNLLLNHFDIQADQFDWEKPLEELHQDFKILSNLVFFEQLLQKEFKQNIPLLENISTAFHSPKHIVTLTMSQLKSP